MQQEQTAADNKNDGLNSIEKSVHPDIIIHKRGKNSHNLLVIEAKKSTNNTPIHDDLRKLEGYTKLNSDNQLQYKYGLSIRFYTGQKKFKNPEVIYFTNGRRIE